MITCKALRINMEFPRDLDNHNRDVVAYVLQKYPRKVVKVSVITRLSIESWYKDNKAKYASKTHVFLLGNVSLMGEIFGLVDDKSIRDADSIEAVDLEDEVEEEDAQARSGREPVN
jgi:hypothetical protein